MVNKRGKLTEKRIKIKKYTIIRIFIKKLRKFYISAGKRATN